MDAYVLLTAIQCEENEVAATFYMHMQWGGDMRLKRHINHQAVVSLQPHILQFM